MQFVNVYEDPVRAAAYDQLEYTGTYLPAFRQLRTLIQKHPTGNHALDFGCGTGRSTRFLKQAGFDTVGIDISKDMLSIAKQRDPSGLYQRIDKNDLSFLPEGGFDLILSAFTFDNIPTHDKKVMLFGKLKKLLAPGGVLINLVSTPEMYTHEWVTFSTQDFPANKSAKTGDVVRIITKDYSDPRPVDDILWPDEAYRKVYAESGLAIQETHRPLAKGDEGIAWINECKIAPWAIYVLNRISPTASPAESKNKGI